MANPPALQQILSPLPYVLRHDIGGYVESVRLSADAIYADADVSPSEVPVDAFLTMAGVWRLWTLVDGQHWLLRNSLAFSSKHGVSGVRLGATTLRSTDGASVDLRRLWMNLRALLLRHDAFFLTSARGLRDVLQGLAGETADGR